MKLALLNKWDRAGGAARAAWRLFGALRGAGADAHYLVHEKTCDDERVVPVAFSHPPSQEIDGWVQHHLIDRNRTGRSNTYFSSTFNHVDWAAHAALREADVLNLHWVEKFVSPAGLASLVRMRKPIVWTLHDQRPFTGGCHYASGCEGFVDNGCRQCLQLRDDRTQLPQLNLATRAATLAQACVVAVSPSRWLAQEAQRSRLLRGKRVVVIPNAVETEIFRPLDKRLSKQQLGVPPESFSILFGAHDTGEARKGFVHLHKAMQTLMTSWKYQELANAGRLNVLLVGAPENLDLGLPLPVFNFGRVTDDERLACVYAAADVFALPSTEDNLPNTMLEAMACGTPVVGFDVGGIPDLVHHRETGLLVQTVNHVALGAALSELLQNPALCARMSTRAADLVHSHYTQRQQARQYLALFEELHQQAPPDTVPPPLTHEPYASTFGLAWMRQHGIE